MKLYGFYVCCIAVCVLFFALLGYSASATVGYSILFAFSIGVGHFLSQLLNM